MKQTEKGLSSIVIVLIIAVLLAAGGAAFYFYRTSQKTPEAVTPVKLTVAGSGSAGFALKNWTDYYEKKNPNVKFEFLPSADTAVGIKGVKEKILDIGVSSRTPETEEEFPEMVMTGFAKDAVVFIVNKSVTGITNLDGQRLKDIYTGKITNWREAGGGEAKIVLIDREEAESAKKLFRSLCFQQEKVASERIEVNSEKDVLSAVVSTPDSIGYLSYGRAKTADVKVLSLNGIGVERGMKNGSYIMARGYYVFTRTDSPKAVKDFIAFLEGEGRDLLEQFFYFTP